MAGNRGGRAESGLTALVLATYGNVCHLRMPGCQRVATTKDHLIPYSLGGSGSLENLRPACKRCNSKRQNRVLSGYGAIINVLIGPPASGKSTHVREHSRPGDLIIDLDVIARALMPIAPDSTHVYPEHVRHVAIGARKAAIDRATRLAAGCNVWIIHAVPHPNVLAEYRALRYNIITIDPGRAEVERRAFATRPRYMWPAIAKWYASGLASSSTDDAQPADSPPSPSPSSSSSGDFPAPEW